jgi:hypothetical protein
LVSTLISEESADGMDILIKEITFLDEASFLQFKSDPIVVLYIAERNEYELNNSIIRFKEDIN